MEDLENDLKSPSDICLNRSLPNDSTESYLFSDINIPHLVGCLPPVISCSPLHVHLSSSGENIFLFRRELNDARQQLKSALSNNVPALKYFEEPSDLVPGVYEGGLKTWECSLDLVQCLDSLDFSNIELQGKRVLEVGCGTAIPSLYLLLRLFSDPMNSNFEDTEFHFQDYNIAVLELITFPNVFLAWYFSAYAPYHSEHNIEVSAIGVNKKLDLKASFKLQITPALKRAFLASLREFHVFLRFFSGSWNTFEVSTAGGKYDLILTSETIYHLDNIPSLITLLRTTSISESDIKKSQKTLRYCFVAAKVIYFGVGGGLSEFVAALEASKYGKVQTVWESEAGVARKVIDVKWA